MNLSDLARGALGIQAPEGKALVRADYATPQPDLYGGRQQTRHVSSVAHQHLQAYGGSEAVDWVMNNVRLIMETASTADYHFERKGTEYVRELTPDMDGRKTKQADPFLVELMKEPNPWFTYKDMMELLIIDLLLVGNGFWFKFRASEEGKPLALYRLAPPLISVIPGKSRLVDAYQYQIPGSEPVLIRPEDMVHFKLPNPHDPYLGLGLIAGGPRVYDIELNLVETQASFFERGARWLGLLSSDRTVPNETVKKVRKTLATMYLGPRNSGSVPILERGLTWTSISADAQQGGFKEMTEVSRDRIDRHFRTDMLHDAAASGNVAMLKAAQRRFDKMTMRPLLDRIQERVSLSLTQAWDLDFKIDYDYTMPPEDALDLATGLAIVPGVKVVEVRKQAGLPPLGDWRDEIVLNLPGENDNASNVKDPALGGEAGRPPKPGNTAAIPADPNKLPKDAAVQAPAARARVGAVKNG